MPGLRPVARVTFATAVPRSESAGADHLLAPWTGALSARLRPLAGRGLCCGPNERAAQRPELVRSLSKFSIIPHCASAPDDMGFCPWT